MGKGQKSTNVHTADCAALLQVMTQYKPMFHKQAQDVSTTEIISCHLVLTIFVTSFCNIEEKSEIANAF